MSKPRVLLVNPRMSRPSSARFPLSLLALGAAIEDRYDHRIIDGNVDRDAVARAVKDAEDALAVGVTVMPGTQVGPAIEMSQAIRAAHPRVPIIWGGYFPTMYADAAINATYVDFVVRGQGEDTLLELLERLPATGTQPGKAGDLPGLAEVRGLTWKRAGEFVHNPDRAFKPPESYPPMRYDRLGDIDRYLRPSFLGTRTGVHQVATGCRYRCTFCGVATFFNGHTDIPAGRYLADAMQRMRKVGVNCVQYYDHNYFDREASYMPLLEVQARDPLPWWCYARADALAKASPAAWRLIERSQLKMAYIGAESASDEVLKKMRKGSAVDYTFEAVKLCRAHGVIPELSFVLGGPEDPEGEIEKTFRTIRALKAIHPRSEIILYFYSPTPQRSKRRAIGPDSGKTQLPVLDSYGPSGPSLPSTPEEWIEKRWVDYVCHRDAPWLSERTRQRVKDFAQVLSCRFPTAQDVRTPAWGKALLRGLASWRYATERYDRPVELDWARRFIRLRVPQRESL